MEERSVIACEEGSVIINKDVKGNEITNEPIRPNLKVPGEVVPIGRMSHEVLKLRSELKQKTVSQLKEVLERQEKTLSNKNLLVRLPDKGERVRMSRNAIKDLLEERRKEEGLATQLERMRINTEKMEWKNRLLDSDDDSDPEYCGPAKNPLSVLVEGDLPPVKDLDKRTVQHSEMVDTIAVKAKFIPFESVKKSSLDDDLRQRLGGVMDCKRSDSVKVTHPPTPSIPLPPTYKCKTTQLSITDSLKLQQKQAVKHREATLLQAQERLALYSGPVGSSVDGVKEDVMQFGDYRDNTERDSDSDVIESDGEEGLGVVGVHQVSED